MTGKSTPYFSVIKELNKRFIYDSSTRPGFPPCISFCTPYTRVSQTLGPHLCVFFGYNCCVIGFTILTALISFF